MQMYHHAGPQGYPPDTGGAIAGSLQQAEMMARSHFAAPSRPEDEKVPNMDANDKFHYNLQGGLPVKYSQPSELKDRLMAQQAVREAAGESLQASGNNVIRTDPIRDEEIQYLQSMKAQSELADFDRYVNSLIDPRKPGNLKWLMELYPDFVKRRIQQVHTDYEFALRNQMIDSWGINTFDDLHFKYLVDQGKIDGPRLGNHVQANSNYAPGWLSPFNWRWDTHNYAGVRLPYASAKTGRKPQGNNPDNWAMTGEGQALDSGRDLASMAAGMYKYPSDGPLGPRVHGMA